MALTKQNITINFSQGLDTKTDTYQVPIGKFLNLKNSIFLKGGQLSKRNGYQALPNLPAQASFLTTFNGDLTAIGDTLQTYAPGAMKWSDKGSVLPLDLSVIPLVRSNTSQTQADISVSANDLICTVYTDQNPASLGTSIHRYVISNLPTGQNVIAPVTITNADPQYGTPRVFVLGIYFVIVFTSTSNHLQYIAISTANPTIVTTPADISTSYSPGATLSFDGVVFNNSLYLAWNDVSNTKVNMAYLTRQLSLSSSTIKDSAHGATMMSVTVDNSTGAIWAAYFSNGTNNAYALAVDQNLNTILAPVEIIIGQSLANLTSVATGGTLTFLYEVFNAYSYDSSVPTNFTDFNTLTQSGSVGSQVQILRSVGLASKAFILNGTIYCLFSYQSPYQSTYFLSTLSGNIVAKLASGNGRGYLPLGLPSVYIDGNTVQIPYLIQDLIEAVNKNTNVPSGSQVAGVYSQLGINLASFTIENTNILSAEIGSNLNITGGFVWAYDGYTPVEQGFFVWPDSIELATAATGGALSAQTYFYQVTYEWTDNQGNAFRSAPSIPVSIVTTGSTSANTINVPTLRLTYKTANPVKIVIYRWSTAQQIYYQVTSIQMPLLNDPTVDQFAFVDTLSDASILGNNIIYTNGGVLENISPPSLKSVFIFDDRLWGIDSEDNNLIWFSKQVIESTPVEMSDLLTIYVAPNIGAQGSTGPLICGCPMDDKVILFKATAINYIAGTGPDNTGANNQYTQPIFITATVGCSNQKSIVFQPQGLMFEFASEAGNQIWLLGRDLTTQYIGAAVESYTQNATIQSAVNVPGTNQVRFTLSSGITLMFDYYYQQWGTFVNVPAISSTLYQGLHTYINSLGQVFQESPGVYLDNAYPVLMSFTTSWIDMAGLQGYQRAYEFSLLGTYYSPHKLNVQVGYDYNPNPSSQVLITPNNFSPVYGQDLVYGSGNPYGGNPSLEQWRIGMKQQRCQSFQITVDEVYDASYGIVSGRGLTLSGINCVVGIKRGFRPYRAATSAGLS